MPEFTTDPILGVKFEEALNCACNWHKRQIRKFTGVPYVAHLLGVASKVIKAGGDETAAIAALLHDALEDAAIPFEEIESRFGTRVAAIVATLSECSGDEPKPPWEERKLAYIQQIKRGYASAVVISAADKLDNLEDYIREALSPDYQTNHSKQNRDLWFYGELMSVYRGRLAGSFILQELESALDKLNSVYNGVVGMP